MGVWVKNQVDVHWRKFLQNKVCDMGGLRRFKGKIWYMTGLGTSKNFSKTSTTFR